jgi:Ni,Fe-hydrogenase III large subunit
MPYWIYGEYGFSPVVQEGGDVYARLVVLLLEAYESIKLAERCVRELDDAPSRGTFPAEVPSGSASATIEGPRGRIRYAIESDGTRLTTVRIDTPRQFDRLLVRTFFSGAAIDNAALIAASAYPCIACAEC